MGLFLDSMNFSDEMLVNIELTSTVINMILYVISFVFKAIAIYTLSKKNGFKHLYLSFIPFLNFILLGKLVGKMILWGKPINNIGVFVCIFTALEFAVGIFFSLNTYATLMKIVLEFVTKGTVIIDNSFINMLYQNAVLWYLLEIVYLITSIAKIFFEVSLVFALFRKYAPQNYILFSILSIFIEFTFGFFLFAVRKNKPMSQEEYLREMAKKRGYYVYRVNPNDFNNPYNPYNPYNGQRPQQQKPQEEDPFPEFSDKKTGGTNQSNGEGKQDDLFD